MYNVGARAHGAWGADPPMYKGLRVSLDQCTHFLNNLIYTNIIIINIIILNNLLII